MSNNELFTEINPNDEASLSGGYGGRGRRGYGRRAPGSAAATADAQASGRNVLTDSFTIAEVDRHGNSFAASSSTAIAVG